MPITVLVFGQIMDLTQEQSLSVTEVADTDALKAVLLERYPALSTLPFVMAVDKKAIRSNTVLSSSSEVALLPPFSGG